MPVNSTSGLVSAADSPTGVVSDSEGSAEATLSSILSGIIVVLIKKTKVH